ncbi:MAG: hypothetical protein EOP18_08660, partial [Rhizobiaceae bacterium]
MSQHILSAVLDVLKKVAQGAPVAEIDNLSTRVRDLAATGGMVAFSDDFQQQVNSIRQVMGDNAQSQRGLTLLIETAHDLSSTLTLDELLRTIVRRARSLIGAN